MMFALRFLLSDRVTASATRHLAGAVGAGVVALGLDGSGGVDAQVVGGAVATLAAFGLGVIKELVR